MDILDALLLAYVLAVVFVIVAWIRFEKALKSLKTFNEEEQ